MPAPQIFTPGDHALGTPEFRVPQPKAGARYAITGVTRDSSGAVLPGCVVSLYRSSTDVIVDTVTSDGSGNYSFPNVTAGDSYYLVAYLIGAPDVAGTTVDTLVGV